jgi:hypothetical protein
VARAERALDRPFPDSYRAFVSELGAGDAGGEEFFGLVDGDFEDSAIPDAVWLTLTERRDSGLPPELILVHAAGDGAYHALDRQGRVVRWEPGGTAGDPVADSFGQFFRRTVEDALA